MVPIWLDGIYRTFAQALDMGRLPGSVLITGRPGTGIHELVADCIRTYLCLNPAAGHPCGSCRSCQLLAGLGHPDFAALLPAGAAAAAAGRARARPRSGSDDTAPVMAGDGDFIHALTLLEERLRERLDGDDAGGTIRIDALRRLNAYLHESPVIGLRRAALITHAHLMQAAGSNAILKLFEEPPVHTLIILVADSPELLLPTILSRSFRLSAGSSDPAQAMEFLCSQESVPPRRAAFALACAQGEPYTAQRLITTDQDRLAAQFIFQLARLAAERSMSVLEETVAALMKLSRARRLLLIWLTAMDILKYQSGFAPGDLPLLGSCGADEDAQDASDRLIRELSALPREGLLRLLTELCRLQAESRTGTLPVRADDSQLRTLLAELTGLLGPAA